MVNDLALLNCGASGTPFHDVGWKLFKTFFLKCNQTCEHVALYMHACILHCHYVSSRAIPLVAKKEISNDATVSQMYKCSTCISSVWPSFHGVSCSRRSGLFLLSVRNHVGYLCSWVVWSCLVRTVDFSLKFNFDNSTSVTGSEKCNGKNVLRQGFEPETLDKRFEHRPYQLSELPAHDTHKLWTMYL